ncbi:extracellular solute-binding protein [Paenibacillus hodogayensis]|uniref:Extracellular solute-binding protein n=1 Tax=Paenibacillus hodogayensis TaxID=279208 RepID=A0ABV5W1W4_9BACL
MDIVRVAGTLIQSEYLDLGLGYDLNELIKKNKYDTSIFNPLYFKQLANNAGATKGEVYGLPINLISPYVLYYNKDLFNRFGIPFPKNGMTWDETYEIANKLNRVEGGVNYQGFSAVYTEYLRDNQLAVPALDPGANKMNDTEKWKPLFDNLLRFYPTVGNPIGANSAADQSKFIKERTASMLLAQLNTSVRSFPADLNWDMVSLLVFKEKPNAGSIPPPAYFSITQQSKHKEAAFEVIQYLLSKEVQLEHSKEGRGTSLIDPEVQQAFGQNSEVLKTKNISAIFYHKNTEAMPARKEGLIPIEAGVTQKIISDAFIDVATGKSDINTVLSTAQEKIGKEIENVKNK